MLKHMNILSLICVEYYYTAINYFGPKIKTNIFKTKIYIYMSMYILFCNIELLVVTT